MSINVIGLTGPTGSGKSTVASLFKEKGIPVIDADLAAREVVAVGSPALEKLRERFSKQILNPDGSLNRSELAKRAFESRQSTEDLNNITHPFIVDLISKQIKEYERKGFEMVVIDAPLLIEAGADSICDTVIAVLANRKTRIERIIKRDTITMEQALQRINAQKADKFYKDHADHIIYNNNDETDAMEKMNMIITKLEYNNEV